MQFSKTLSHLLAPTFVAVTSIVAFAAPAINPANNHYYEAVAVSGGVTWQQASAAASARTYQGFRGHLVSIESAAENQFVVANCQAAISGNWWIGGFQDKSQSAPEPAGNWKWVGGAPIQYFNWQTGEPSNSISSNSSDDFLQILSNGKWNDNIGLAKLGGYVVEYEAAAPVPTGKIAFGSSEIWVINADGTNLTNLTSSGVHETNPSFNGDGSKLTYVVAPTFNSTGWDFSEIYIMNSDGGNKTRLTDNSFFDGDPQFSSDGTKVVFVSNRDGHSEIYSMNADGSNQARLTNRVGGGFDPVINKAGSKIAFVSVVNSNYEVFIMNVDGSGQTQLTNTTDHEQEPTFTPDGSTLLYTRRPDFYQIPRYHLMSISGANQRLLSSTLEGCAPIYSPDGMWVGDNGILIFRADGSTKIFDPLPYGLNVSWAVGNVPPPPPVSVSVADAASLEGDSPTITRDHTNNITSPQTKQVFFTVRLANALRQPYTINYNTQSVSAIEGKDYSSASGSITFQSGTVEQKIAVPLFGDLLTEADETFTLILSDPTNSVTGDFTAIGTILNDDNEALGGGKIAFMSARDGNNEIYVMNADGSSPANITNTLDQERHPAWNADGSKLIFSKSDASSGAGADIFTMNEDGSSILNLTNDGPDDMEPTFHPNGSQAVYSSFGGSDYDVFTVPLSGGTRTLRINNSLGDYHPKLNSIGDKITFYTFPDGQNADIFVASSSGANQVRLTSASGHDRYPDWSPLGDKIVFTSQRDGNDEIYVMNADGSNQTRITDNSASDEQPCFSPDGSQIAFASNRDGNYEIYVMDADGSNPTRITYSNETDTFPAWSTGEVAASRPTISVNDFSVLEGQTGVFTVELSHESNRKIDVVYMLTDNPGGNSYSGITLTFAPGETSKTVNVPVPYNTTTDAIRYRYLNLRNPRNAAIEDAQGVATITDRGRPNLSIHSDSAGQNFARGGLTFETQSSPNNTITSWIGAGQISTYEVRVKNTAATSRTFVLRNTESDTGTANNAIWSSSYEINGVSIASALQSSSGYTTRLLAPGEVESISIRLTPSQNVPLDAGRAVDISAAQEEEPDLPCDLVRAHAVRGVYQPDLLISVPNTSGVLGDGIYDSEGVGQEKQVEVANNQKATYLITVQNDGEVAGVFKLQGVGSAAGWSVKCFEAISGNDLTYSIVGDQGFSSGWETGTIQPGQSRQLRLEVTPDATVSASASFTYSIMAFSLVDYSKADAVKTTTRVFAAPPADLLIKKSTEADAAFALNDVYQSTPAGEQIEAQTVNPGVKATYNVRVQNDSASPRAFIIKAVEGAGANWNIVYKLGSNDISNALRSSAGRTTATLVAGAVENLTIEVTPNSSVVRDVGKSVTLNVFNTGDATVRDSVQTMTTAPPLPIRKPDVAIRTGAEAEYSGDNVYNTNGAGQTKTQLANTATAALYFLSVQNDGNIAEAIKLQSSGAPSGWAIKYFNNETNIDISSAIASSNGWTTSSLAPGATQVLRLEVKPSSSIAGGVKSSITLTATSTGNTSIKDAVIATTESQSVVQADAHIRKSTEADAAFALNDVYQSTPVGEQIEAQNIQAGQKATYAIRIQNDGNSARSFIVQASESGAGWSAIYKVGSSIVTTSLKAPTGRATAVLSPGASEIITAEISAAAGLGVGASQSTLFQVFNDAAGVSSNQVRDSVQTVTTVTPLRVVKIDALVRPSVSSNFVGDGIYNGDGKNQIATQSVARNVKAIYFVRVHNEGNTAEPVKINAPLGNSRWSVQYFNDATGADITSSVVQSGGWLSPALAPDASQIIRIEVMPNNTTPVGGNFDCSLTAISAADNSSKDVVKTNTTVR